MHGVYLRAAMLNSGIPTYRIADEMGISEYALRHLYGSWDVPEETANAFFDALDRLKAKERKAKNE